MVVWDQNVLILVIIDCFVVVYCEDMVVFGVVLLDIELEVIVYILQIIEMIEQLIEVGYVYVVEGYVLFVVGIYVDYGKFLWCDFDEMFVGVCVDVVLYKCDLGDFVLWKLFFEDLFGWVFFWGCGCLGWYIECLVMVVVYLGLIIDIYVGGVDLQFLYYENEIVQSECVYGGQIFVCFWLYNGMFNFGGVKMSKLIGNIECVYDLVCVYVFEVLCYVLLLVYYWQLLDWFDVLIEQFVCMLDGLYGVFCEVEVVVVMVCIFEVIEVVFDEDFNMLCVLVLLLELVRKLCYVLVLAGGLDYLCEGVMLVELVDLKSQLFGVGKVLGLLQQVLFVWFGSQVIDSDEGVCIQVLIDECMVVKQVCDFVCVDLICDVLVVEGIVLEDIVQGVCWVCKC